MRTGAFQQRLVDWTEQPCALIVTVAPAGAQIRYSGILRRSAGPRSLRGWHLIAPPHHGGSRHLRRIALNLEGMRVRRVGDAGLDFWQTADLRFRLELDGA